jgi:membrane associated rhomboid family serine protease
VLVYLITVAQGAGINSPGGHLFNSWALVIRGTEFTATGQHLVGVAEGEWWRLITASFLHASLLHLGFNMLGLWWFGAPVEAVLGRARFLLLYVVSGLAGSAGALIASPHGVTVGASGALFGLLGAAVVLERFGLFVFGGSAVAIIVINLAFTLLVPGVSIGGHLGGLIGGALGAYALLRLGRVESMYGRVGMAGYAGLAAVGLLSVLVAVLQVSRYA